VLITLAIDGGALFQVGLQFIMLYKVKTIFSFSYCCKAYVYYDGGGSCCQILFVAIQGFFNNFPITSANT